MAHNNTEIEMKIKVDKTQFLSIKEKLLRIAKFEKETHQVDEYFTPTHRKFLSRKYPNEWMSLRKRGDKNILNYKYWHPKNAKIKTHCDEYEVAIDDALKLKKIFDALDVKTLIVVDKNRLTYNFNGEFEIALDHVKELGYFIEIETIKDFGSIKVAREKLFLFAKKLGLKTFNPDLRGYPYQLLNKKGLIK